MIYLLDTDTLIFMIRGTKPGRRPATRRRALELTDRCRQAQADGDTVGLSAITISELEFGAQNAPDYDSEIAAVGKVLGPFDLFDYDRLRCPPHYGRIRAELERKGLDIGAMDLLIAAHTLALDATLVTNNLTHFRRVPDLKVVNWVSTATS